MVETGVEAVPLEPARVVDQRAVAAQLLDEHPVAQALRAEQVVLGRGDARLQRNVGRLHAVAGLDAGRGYLRPGARSCNPPRSGAGWTHRMVVLASGCNRGIRGRKPS